MKLFWRSVLSSLDAILSRKIMHPQPGTVEFTGCMHNPSCPELAPGQARSFAHERVEESRKRNERVVVEVQNEVELSVVHQPLRFEK